MNLILDFTSSMSFQNLYWLKLNLQLVQHAHFITQTLLVLNGKYNITLVITCNALAVPINGNYHMHKETELL